GEPGVERFRVRSEIDAASGDLRTGDADGSPQGRGVEGEKAPRGDRRCDGADGRRRVEARRVVTGSEDRTEICRGLETGHVRRKDLFAARTGRLADGECGRPEYGARMRVHRPAH